ncbi:hypothetical protein H6F89_02995 [Cyanobacteria bacterium FACHB-63]|nr:hypothetical protein [Cyanobacteria bacterium FACHB-63]
MLKFFLLPSLGFLLVGLSACSQSSTANNPEPPKSPIAQAAPSQVAPASVPTKPGRNLSLLFSRVWRVTKAPSSPAPGSIYVFLPNGTLLQTSCGEPYRIATWRINKGSPDILRVTEDGRQAYTARITQLTDTTLQIQRSLDRSNQNQALTLTAVQQEFVCPDSRR